MLIRRVILIRRVLRSLVSNLVGLCCVVWIRPEHRLSDQESTAKEERSAEKRIAKASVPGKDVGGPLVTELRSPEGQDVLSKGPRVYGPHRTGNGPRGPKMRTCRNSYSPPGALHCPHLRLKAWRENHGHQENCNSKEAVPVHHYTLPRLLALSLS